MTQMAQELNKLNSMMAVSCDFFPHIDPPGDLLLGLFDLAANLSMPISLGCHRINYSRGWL